MPILTGNERSKVSGMAETGIIMIDSEDRIINMNPAAHSIIDHACGDVQGTSILQMIKLVDARSNASLDHLFKEVAETGQIKTLPESVTLMTRKDNYRISGFIAPIKKDKGKVTSTAIFFKNDPESYNLYTVSNRTEVFYNSLFDTMSEGCQIIGYDFRYAYLNKAALEQSKRKRYELLGRTMYDVYPGIEKTKMYSCLKKCMEHRVPQDLDNLFAYKDGEKRWYRLRMRPVPEGAFILSLDVTDQKILEQKNNENKIYNTSLLMVIPDILIRCSSKGILLDIMTSSDEKLFLPKNTMLGKDIADIFDKEQALVFHEHIKKTLTANCLQKIEYSLKTPAGELWFEARTVPFSKNETLSLIVDITEHKQLQEKIFIEKEQFKTTLLSVGDGVISTNERGYVLLMNEAAENITGWKISQAGGMPLEKVMFMVSGYNMRANINPVQRVLDTGMTYVSENNIYIVSKENFNIPVEVNIAPIKNTDTDTTGVVAVIKDMSENAKGKADIEYMNFHDKLTGLYNRKFFEEEIKRLDTERNLPISVIIGDIDGLKIINDSFGSLKGDEFLLKAAEVIKKACRKDDIISRMGGDEFAVLLPNTSKDNAMKVCARINKFAKNAKVRPLNLSITAASATKESMQEKIDDIVMQAENHMYQSKLLNEKSSRSEIVSSLSKALNEMNYETEEHEKRLLKMVTQIGNALGLSPQEIEDLKLLSVLHDVGKLGVSKDIILKPGPLTPEEWREMKKHSDIGSRIAEATPGLSHISEYILSVHERWDGRGYPKGLKGEAIPKLSRILAIVDAYDAMISGRPYKKPITSADAFIEINNCRGTHFDPALVDLFTELFTKNGNGLSLDT